MAPENDKNKNDDADGADEKSHIQEQLLDAIKRSQDAALQIVGTWSESVSRLATKLPDMPKLPSIDSLPKPGEITDQFFDFAQKLMASQQEFVKKLIDTLPGHDKDADKETD
jgi:3-methyladenine DNA glycosylase AlkC